MNRRTVTLSMLLGLMALCLYLSNGRYTGSGDTVPALLLPHSVLNEHDLDFNEFSAPHDEQPYWFAVHEDRVVSHYPVVPGLLNTLPHAIGRLAGKSCGGLCKPIGKLTAASVTAGSVSFLFLALARVCRERKTAVLMAIVYAVCTGAWSVASQGLWQHGPSLFFLTAALACMVRPERAWMFTLGGFCLGMAVFNRPTNVVFALVATIFVVWNHPRFLARFLLGASLPALLMAWYSWAYWGSVLALGQGHSLGSGSHGPHATQFGSSLSAIWAGFLGILVSPARGLFVYTPVFVFALPLWLYALWPWARIEPVLRSAAVGAATSVLLFSSWSIWWGGWSFGYRLLLEVIPYLILITALTYEQWIAPNRWLKAAFVAAALLSFYIHLLGAMLYPTDWNGRVDIDNHPERAWDWYDSELVSLHTAFVARVRGEEAP